MQTISLSPLDPSKSARQEQLGQLLVDRGWKQGVLLPALTYAVVCDPGARASEAPYGSSVALPQRQDVPRHELAVSYTGKASTQLVIVSQTCDISADPSHEWLVEAMMVQVVRNERTLAEARASARRFVLDESRDLVVDARVRTSIDKAYLATLSPSSGAPDVRTERAFARWLARRAMRAAHPDDFVNRVLRPIKDYLKELRRQDGAQAARIDALRPRVFAPYCEAQTYDCELLFVLPTTADVGTEERRDLESAIAGIASELRRILGTVCSSLTWTAVRLEELSAADYLDTDEIPTE